MVSKRFQKLLEQARQGDDYWIAAAQVEFTEQLHELMQRRRATKSELARRIGSSPAYVTKVMRGSTNFTLASMVRLVRALGGHLQFRVCAREDQSRWIHVHGSRPARPEVTNQTFRPLGITLNDSQFGPDAEDELISDTA